MRRVATSGARSSYKMSGPPHFFTRGYVPGSQTLANVESLAKRVFTGVKPHFPSKETKLIKDPVLRKEATAREYEDYCEFVRKTKEIAEDVAIDVAKDQSKKIANALLAGIVSFIAMMVMADNDLKKAREEIEKEKKNLEKELEALNEDEQIKKKWRAELENSYNFWTDLWTNTDREARLEVKKVLFEIAEAQKILEKKLEAKEAALKKLEAIQKIREHERDEITLSITP
jgi:hypothetical protein